MARVALDAGVVIGLYDDQDAHHEWAVNFMIQTTAETLQISSLNYAEISVAPVRQGNDLAFFSGISGLGIEIKPVETADTLQLAKLRVETGLRMTDVCAIQLAIKNDCALATTDKAVAKAARSLGIEVYQP